MLRVATLNLWNRHEPWDARLRAIREGLRALAPDVCGLQEVLHPCVAGLGADQATQVAEGLGYHVAFGPAWELGGVEFGNAVLSRWPIVETRTLALPDGGTDESRCLVFASIDAPFGRLPFFVTHLNWKLDEGHVRERQVRAVAEHVASLAPTSGFPPVLVGDFNAEPGSDEVRFLRGLCSLGGPSVYFADAFELAGGDGPGATFARSNPFAAKLREPDRRIDYVFVRGPDAAGRGLPIEARRCFDSPLDGVYPSDHYGVVATLTTEADR